MKRAAMGRWLCIMLILLVPRSLNAASVTGFNPPPKMPNMDNLPSTLTSPPTSKVLLGKLVVEFERTTLGEVQKSAGVGSIQHRGDAGDSEDWLCYTTLSREQPERIWISSGELGGSNHTVGSFYAAVSSKATKGSAHCPELPAQLRPVSLGNALWLGSSLDQLKELFGEPSTKRGNWWFYSYSGKVPANGFDQIAILGVRVTNGKIVALFASQATTN